MLISIVKNLMDRKTIAEFPVAPAADDSLTAPRQGFQHNYNTAELNSKRAKIDELLKRSAQPASENGVENGNMPKVDPQPGNGRHSDALPITSPSREVEIIEDLNMDNILELDDILPNTTSIQTMGQVMRPDAFIDRAQTQLTAGAFPYETQERLIIPNSVIDEIVNRVSAQLFEKLSSEIARRVAPEVVELVRRQLFPEPANANANAPFRDSENLLDID
jgi:hypothetical protein